MPKAPLGGCRDAASSLAGFDLNHVHQLSRIIVEDPDELVEPEGFIMNQRMHASMIKIPVSCLFG